MSVRSRIALIRFGHGLRLGEAPPANPEAWLGAQLATPGPPPEGPSVAEALRARATQNAMRDAALMQAAPGAPAATPAAPAQRGPMAQLIRAESIAWAARRLTTAEPFRERLVDFWMNHFTVSRRSGTTAPLPGTFERDAIRPHLTGRFADMMVAAALHPAMLIYLDNIGSVGPNSPFGQRRNRGLNENLAREVLELHSLSPAGGYTQGDVQELAKILTGFTVVTDQEPFAFVFRPQTHEPGDKQVLGRRFGEGQAAAEAALRMLGTHPATYRHLAVKLARHFVADQPPPEATRALERVLQDSGGDLGAVSRALIRLPQTWEKPLGKFRSPIDYVIAGYRALGLPPERADALVGALFGLSQPLWTAPQPIGWPDMAADWATPEAMMRRVDWAYTATGRFNQADPGAVTEAALGPFARAETVAAMRGAGSVRDALTLLLGSPEFMYR
jgi:uncharacterized protein (DUF1800 family)